MRPGDLPDTVRGRDAATMVHNGSLRGLSVEFNSEMEGRRRPRPHLSLYPSSAHFNRLWDFTE